MQYPGAICHLISRGDRREDVFLDDGERQDFLKTLAETGQKPGFQVHAYYQRRHHFPRAVETPDANWVTGMAWLLSAHTLRLHHRHQLCGHVFSGRYQTLIVEARNSSARGGSEGGGPTGGTPRGRLAPGTAKSANSKLHLWMKANQKPGGDEVLA